MRIVFIGTVEFSKKTLEKLIDLKAEIVGVCTKRESACNSDYSDLVSICVDQNIPYRYVEDINNRDNIEWIRSLSADIIFCFGWSSLIKKELLYLCPMGVVGYHPAKLPKNRGRHPLIWALVLGLKQSASTFFFMKEGVDDGDIFSQKDFEISDHDDAMSLYLKMTEFALVQIEEFLPQLKNGSFTRIVQNPAEANVWRKRTKDDGKIDFRMSSNAIYNLVRALVKPYVGAHVEYNGEDIKIWKVRVLEEFKSNFEYGKVLQSNINSIIVKTYDGAIEILEHDFRVLPKRGEYL